MATTVFNTTPIEGINFNTTYTISTSSPELPGVPLQPGLRVTGSAGSEWILCQVATSKTVVEKDFVVVTDHTTWQIDQLSNTTGKNFLGSRVGVAAASATAGVYVWVQFGGTCLAANCLTGSLAFTVLHTTATAGRIDDTASAGNSAIVTGVVQLATAASNVANVTMNGAAVGAND